MPEGKGQSERNEIEIELSPSGDFKEASEKRWVLEGWDRRSQPFLGPTERS
jgi:hypothetical protein